VLGRVEAATGRVQAASGRVEAYTLPDAGWNASFDEGRGILGGMVIIKLHRKRAIDRHIMQTMSFESKLPASRPGS
jgi:hypothetical protein